MKNGFRTAAVMLFALVLAGFAIVPHIQAQNPNRSQSGTWSINPVYLTTTTTNVCNLGGNHPPCNVDVWACQGDVNAAAGTAATITITDNQMTPVPFWQTVAPLSASNASSYKIWEAGSHEGCRYFPGGMLVKASANTTIYFAAGGFF